MVDVSAKKVTVRTAKASGFVRMSEKTVSMIKDNLLPKGEPFETARIAGILAAKGTSSAIPLCHPLLIEYVDVQITLTPEGAAINSEIRIEGKTGAEMEALMAVSIAALTVYDMCKAVDKDMIIEGIRLIEKRGGKSDYNAKV
jgi:cyclic pyranopterin phosphate synthase